MDTDANHQPQPAAAPERTPLTRLARPGASSPALLRIVGEAAADHGPARVAVAAFQSSV